MNGGASTLSLSSPTKAIISITCSTQHGGGRGSGQSCLGFECMIFVIHSDTGSEQQAWVTRIVRIYSDTSPSGSRHITPHPISLRLIEAAEKVCERRPNTVLRLQLTRFSHNRSHKMAVVGLTTCKLLTFKEKLVGVRRFELPAPCLPKTVPHSFVIKKL